MSLPHPVPIDFTQKRVNHFRNLPHGEPDLVQAFFAASANGFYVDVGANHPTEDSQSWHLECLGWRGLLIEPLPQYCEMLRAARSGRVVQVACSSPINDGKTMPMLVAGVHSTLNANPIALGANAQAVMQVPTRTLDAVLLENQVQPGFDLLSIDVEGHEMEVFQGFDLSRWHPRLVLLEDHVIGLEKHRYMRSHSYQLLMRTGLNAWYVPDTEGYTLSLYARWQMWRKYWLGLWWRQIKYRRP